MIRGFKVPCPAIRRSPNTAPDAVRGKTRCRGPDLNWGHRNFQSRALPTELPRHNQRVTGALIKLAYATEASMPYARCHLLVAQERAMRFELTTFSLARRRSTAELRPHRHSAVMVMNRSAAACAAEVDPVGFEPTISSVQRRRLPARPRARTARTPLPSLVCKSSTA